jgi:hypothetical protein
MNDDVLCVLLVARTIIDCEGWTQETYARTADGDGTDVDDPKASCFCSLGAIWAVSFAHGGQLGAITAVERAMNSGNLVGWNDAPGRTKEEVLSAFDRAIAAEEARLGD